MITDNKNDCVGCKACLAICPINAIDFKTDEQGFSYPIIQMDKCIECGLCEKVCQIGHEHFFKYEEPKVVYGVKNVDSVRKHSSSGGIFTALAEYILADGGIVCGMVFSDKMKVVHTSASSFEDVKRMCGSKYIQSDMKSIYSEVVINLCSGKRVLFSGTPCQITAIKKFLISKQIDTNNLITIDLICHGVPSPRIWSEYIESIEKKYHKSVVDYSFRDKEKGWKGYHIRVTFDDGSTLTDDIFSRSFVTLFSRDLIIRPSCFYCQYASTSRCGDITIGDFWGLDKVDASFCDNKGVSMVISNTNKGKTVLNDVLCNLNNKEYDDSCLLQPNLHDPSNFGDEYDEFWHDYKKHDFSYVSKKYGKVGVIGKVYDYYRRIKYRLSRL